MITIAEQVYIFLYAVIGGALIAFLYDILRIKRRTIKTGIVIVTLEDILYWLVSAVLMFILVYNTNNGEIRGYIFIGNTLGVILYLSLLSKLIITSSMMIIKLIKKILAFIWKIFSYPFKLIFKILAIPCSFIFRIVSKLFKFIHNKARRVTKKGIVKTRAGVKKLGRMSTGFLKFRKKA